MKNNFQAEYSYRGNVMKKKHFFSGPVVHNIERDATIGFCLEFTLIRIERKIDKKVVPLELHIDWWFWTWHQRIFFLF